MKQLCRAFLILTISAIVACTDSSSNQDGAASNDATTANDTGTSTADGAVPYRGLGFCYYNFTLNITSGPDMGTKIKGVLEIRQDGQALSGRLVEQAADGGTGRTIAVAGQLNGSAMTLTFTIPGGGQITGTGTVQGEFSACQAQFEGNAMGPMSGDTGDWGGLLCISNGKCSGCFICICGGGCAS